jgi:hypothetical protein
VSASTAPVYTKAELELIAQSRAAYDAEQARRDPVLRDLRNLFGKRLDELRGRRRDGSCYISRRVARLALTDLADMVALVGLHLPVKASGMVTKVIDALEEIVGPPVEV